MLYSNKPKPKLKLPTRSRYPNTRKAYQDKIDERESWHKLVVKIISWKDGALRECAKITTKEWSIYSHRVLKTNVTIGRQKTQNNLNEIKAMIKNHDGFEQELS